MMHPPGAYQVIPLELFSVVDLTDALGVAKSAELLGVTPRSIYSVRSTNMLSANRMAKLIDAVRVEEAACRLRLIIKRNKQEWQREHNKQGK